MNLFRSSTSLRHIAATSFAFVALAGVVTLASPRDARASACLQDAANDTGLSCSSNDVNLASVSVTNITDNCDFPGDTFTFNGLLNVQTNATTRYDIVYYL